MNKTRILNIFIITTLLMSFCVNLYADELDEPISDEEPQESSVSTSWLEHLPDSFGAMGLIWELNRQGDESLFDSRYFDRYKNNSLRLENLDLFYLISRNTYIDGHLSTNGYTRSITKLEYVDPLKWRFDFDNKSTRFFEMPSMVESRRKDSKMGVTIGGSKSDFFEFTGGMTHRADNSINGASFDSQWKTRDFRFKYNFDIPEYDLGVGYSKRIMKGERARIHDVTHSTWTLHAGKERGANTYLSGNASYTSSNVQYYNNLTSFALGGSGRFINPLGIDNMIVSAGVNYVDRNDSIGMLHPLGDSIGMYLRARYRASSNIRLNGAIDMNRNDTYFPNRAAIDELKGTRGLIPLQAGALDTATVQTNKTRFGADIRLTDYASVSADLKNINRRGLEETNYGFDNSPLMHNREFMQDYKLRYRSGRAGGPGLNNWELRYMIHDKSIKPRDLTNSSEHFTVNWSGFLADNFYFYAGCGFVKSSLKMIDTREHDLKGNEYGVGFDWSVTDKTNVYFDYWNYDISGSDDFDQTFYVVGLKCKAGKDWSFGIEYELVNNNFDHSLVTDGRTGFLNLRLNYEW